MGSEAKCMIHYGGKRVAGTARLETDVLQFRAPDLRLSIPFAAVRKTTVRSGRLAVTFGSDTATLELGSASARWADKITNPPSRLDKLGVKPSWRASAINIDDRAFLRELGQVVRTLSIGRVLNGSDAIFVGATRIAELSRLEKLKASLAQDGALWIVRPKGRPEIPEAAVMRAGKAAGLVDVKVVRFSGTHTAEKFVIPLAARTKR